MRKYIHVTSDVYFISERIKQVDESYFIVFNTHSQKFEVHSISQKGGTYCFTSPFRELDERTIDYARKTRAENIERIIAEIDAANEKLLKDNLRQAKNKLEEVLL